ncbi:hypothetical protein, partial [Neisseria sicca]|uniref:hypothetical protein n=1 Tax=Neisseria sicca TaxID=490 RepID=UPI001C99209A
WDLGKEDGDLGDELVIEGGELGRMENGVEMGEEGGNPAEGLGNGGERLEGVGGVGRNRGGEIVGWRG